MARRADPTRIEQAHRAGIRYRLIGSGMPEERADRLMAAWDAVAAVRRLQRDERYCDGAWAWIEARRRLGAV